MNETISKTTWYGLGVVTLIGLGLRVYGIEANSLWLDELASWKQSSEPSLAQVIEGMRGNVHPPGWAILLHFTQKVFGDSMTALRLPSVVAGILSVPAIFFLGRFLYSEKEGLISAAIMAVSWAPIYFSHEARAYSLLILLAIVSTHLLLLVLQGIEESKVKYRYLIAYVLIGAIGCYQHYSFVVLMACQGLWAAFFVVRQRRGFALLLGTYLVLLLLYVPWLREIGTDLARESFWAGKPSGFYFVQVFSFFFMKSVYFAALPFALLLSLFILNTIDHKQSSAENLTYPGIFILIWLMFPYAAFYIKALTSAPTLLPRYILVSLPAAYILVARSITVLGQTRANAFSLGAAFSLVSLLVLMYGHQYYTKPAPLKPQFQEAAAYILNHGRAGEDAAIITHFRYGREDFNYFLNQADSPRRVKQKIKSETDDRGRRNISIAEVDQLSEHLLRDGSEHFWIVTGGNNDMRLSRTAAKVLARHNEPIERKKFHKVTLWLFRKQSQ